MCSLCSSHHTPLYLGWNCTKCSSLVLGHQHWSKIDADFVSYSFDLSVREKKYIKLPTFRIFRETKSTFSGIQAEAELPRQFFPWSDKLRVAGASHAKSCFPVSALAHGFKMFQETSRDRLFSSLKDTRTDRHANCFRWSHQAQLSSEFLFKRHGPVKP